jgi:hypothetical protein
MLGFSSSSSSRFSGTITQDQQLPLSPPHILGGGVFDVGSEFVNAASCAVPAADLALFTARVKTSEISRVKSLHLVRVFPVLFLLYIYSPLVVCCSA